MAFPLPLFIDVDPDTLATLLACARRMEGFPAGGANVLAAAAAVEQLIADRRPADPAVVERIFTRGFAPFWEDIICPGGVEVSVEEVAVLLAYARSEIEHVAWCFDALDDEDLENQLPANSVDACPVCHSAYEIEKHGRHVRVWRGALVGCAESVTDHGKFDAEEDEAPGQKPG